MDQRQYFYQQSVRQNGTQFLQPFLTIFWLFWNHRNLVVHQGKIPNPIEVVLISNSLICRYKEAFKDSVLIPRPGIVKQPQTSTQHHWQTIIKVAAYGHRRTRRYGYAFEAIDLEGTRLFIGASSSGRQSVVLTYQNIHI
ncbi:hypothetical protein SO802_021784, partial [Lithocarpus litseifolius]